MNLTLQKGYPDRVGRRARWVGSGKGPKSYVATTGDTITGAFPFQFYIDSVVSGVSVSGTYAAIGQPSAAGPRQTWKLRYITTATGAEVSNAVDLSAEIFVLSGDGGFY